MELNFQQYSSDWLKKMSKNIPVKTSTFKCYPISNFQCCANPNRITSKDGNKTQGCTNCSWTLEHSD